MEFALNLAWSLLAVAMVCAWLRQLPHPSPSRRGQIVALGLLLVILLPAISMTDDLVAAQNPAEIDSCLRRDHDYARAHAVLPIVPSLPALAFAGVPFATLHPASPGIVPAPIFHSPALARILNRPPPAV
jgi:hypothetical protein